MGFSIIEEVFWAGIWRALHCFIPIIGDWSLRNGLPNGIVTWELGTGIGNEYLSYGVSTNLTSLHWVSFLFPFSISIKEHSTNFLDDRKWVLFLRYDVEFDGCTCYLPIISYFNYDLFNDFLIVVCHWQIFICYE